MENASNKITAIKARKILIAHDRRFFEPTPQQKKKIVIAFANSNRVVYGQAFDIVRAKKEIKNKEDFQNLLKDLNSIKLYEIKSTNRKNVDSNFKDYFFSLSTAELLTAQELGENYGIILVHIKTKKILELTVQQLFARSKKIYPSWSIKF